jgi:hypothetical protein
VDRTLDLVAPLVAADSIAHDLFGHLPPRGDEADEPHHCLASDRPLDATVDTAPLYAPKDTPGVRLRWLAKRIWTR